ncbi:parasitophorous vacuolar protein 1, putative [Plasmodium relictum]|uniref:Parasitophorous vacuolar protein 1, putative n=1 Tax=Plasmodium relictum TaxID=85471 RepID=A0A1J1H5X9_PLARL|nr:parasitophorous vacuolar protein 1, putative [Plasmodium relictum]CRH00162.1 parasitophorous vacuolar protein 1, putative [Plasmodium relictum]
MIRIVVALFFFAYTYAFNITDGPLNQEKLFKAVLEVKNTRHQNFVDMMNNESSSNEEERTFENELKKNGYVCLFSKFDIVFKNSSRSFNELLDNGNEDILKEAANDFKIKLIQVINHLSEVISLKDLRNRYEQVFQSYISQLGGDFFGYNNKNVLNQDKHSIFNTPEFTPKLTNYSDRESKGASEEGSDLSRVNNEENLNKISETYSYESFSSSYSDVSDQIEETFENETMTREKALDILIRNAILVMEGECNEESPKKNDGMCMRFGGKVQKNSFTTLCGLSECGVESNSGFLRKAGGQSGIDFFNNKKSMDELVKNIYKLLENTFGINMMENPLVMSNLTPENLRLKNEQINKEGQASESSLDSKIQKDTNTTIPQRNEN